MPKSKFYRGGVLNELRAVSLILYLDEKGEAHATELLAISGNYMRLKILAESLRDEGLVDIKLEEEPRITYTYRLTQKGKKVAEKLKEIEEIIERD